MRCVSAAPRPVRRRPGLRGRIGHGRGRDHVRERGRSGEGGLRRARRAGAPGRLIDGAARDRIGRGLRLHYAGVLALPIPDRLRTLLDDLAACSDTEASQ